MKIKIKKGGLFKIEFKDYFKTLELFKTFIKEGNEFINVDYLEDDILCIYNELTALDIELKTNLVLPLVIKKLNFKNRSAFKLEFWEERGYGIEEFNAWVCKRRNIEPAKRMEDGVFNKFKYGNYKFDYNGEPKCNLCKSNLDFNILIDTYIINKCCNNDCISHDNKDIKTLRQLAFLPIEVFENKNKKINVDSKLTKEYWLLKGFSLDESIKKVKETKEKLNGAHQTTRKYYEITTDMSDDEISLFLKRKSHLSSEYWINRDVDDYVDKIKTHQTIASNEFAKKRKENPGIYSAVTQTQVGYWVKNGFSKEEAKNKVSERQRTFSLDICIEKYGEDKGKERWLDRQKKWHSNFKKNNFSKISQELFWDIYEKIDDVTKKDNEIYFAELNQSTKVEDKSGANHEYRLRLSESYILPDFFIKNKKKIIEFDGTYYHRGNIENKKREKKRDEQIEKSGYVVFHVSEKEYKYNKQKVVNKCLEFLGL